MSEDILRKKAEKAYVVPVGDSYKIENSRWLAFIIIFSFVVLSSVYLLAGFSVYFLIDLLAWIIFYRYSRHVVVEESYSFAKTAFIFFLTLLFSVAIFGLSAPKTFVAVKGNLLVYNNKVLSIRSDDNKVQGSIGLKARYDESTGQEYLEAYYNILISENLRPNGNCGPDSALFGCDKNISYEYAGDFTSSGEEHGIAEGGLVPVFCNKSRLPEDPFSGVPKEHSIQNCDVVGLGSETNTFLLQFIKKYADYADLSKPSKLDIYDGSYFWEKADEANSVDSVDLVMNLDKAVDKGWKVASYNLLAGD